MLSLQKKMRANLQKNCTESLRFLKGKGSGPIRKLPRYSGYHLRQRWRSVSFWYGSGSANPDRGKVEPNPILDPAKALNQRIVKFFFLNLF